MVSTYFQFFSLLLCITLGNGIYVKQSLNGQWTGQSVGGETAVFDATVPGGIFSDLMSNGIIENIFYGTGDQDYSWVGETDWSYSRTFEVDEEFASRRYAALVFDGVDTYATITLNGVEIATTNNMFLRYTLDVKEYIQAGTNNLTVLFSSPVNKAASLAEDSSNEYIIPPECQPPEYHGICHINRLRKMQASFAWDWGPAFASVGIWKDVFIIAFDDVAIDRVTARPQKNVYRNTWSIIVSIYTLGSLDDVIAAGVNITIHLNDEHLPLHPLSVPIDTYDQINQDDIIFITGREVAFDDVDLWWPNGYGEQPLYNITVALVGQVDTVVETVRIGFRTVQLVQEELDQGLSFQFKINNELIFAKGSNQIPLSILPELGQDPDSVRRVLQTARDSNMNMLRVWGGGVYESNYFYDLADEYGILIWQDFMFACAMYPVDGDFLQSVSKEVYYQITRLRNHPSVVIWAGNNENEAALSGNWYNTSDDFDTYKRDYIELYVNTIQPEVMKTTEPLPYLISSPTNGIRSNENEYVADNPYDPYYGDVHFYDYESDSWNVSTFPIPRFASEYGYQSMPCVESWLTATDSSDNLRPDSDFLNNRQHHPQGNQQNLDLIGTQLQLPDASNDNYVQAFIYFSQIVQAQSIKVQTEHYRSFKGRVDENKQGNTTGALYWQLNDVWVAPTWSGMDFTGRWKMLQYFVQEFFSPLLITGRLTDSNLQVYAIYDGLTVPDVTISAVVYVYNWNSLDSLVTVEFPVTLDRLVSVLVTEIDAATAFTTAGCGSSYDEAKANCFFHLHLTDQDNNELAPVNYVFPEKLKNSNLADANVEITSVSTGDNDNEFEILISTDAVALFVWLDSHDVRGRFSENGFLQVSSSKTVNFVAEDTVSVDDLEDALTVTHLRSPAYL